MTNQKRTSKRAAVAVAVGRRVHGNSTGGGASGAAMALAIGLAGLAGCVPAAYQREDMPPSAAEGPPVSSYSITAEGSEGNQEASGQGAVHVISLGSERLPVPAGQPDTYVHLRLAADNVADDTVWKLDPNEQLLIYGARAVRPTFSETSEGAPVLELPRGKRGYLDIYFPLPPADKGAAVKLAWRLRRGERTAAKTTEFTRSAAPDSAYVYYQPGRGYHVYSGLGLDTWWWDDYYFWNRSGLWWPCPRSYIHAHYPSYGGRRYVSDGYQPGSGGGPSPSTANPRPSRGSSWRGSEAAASGGDQSGKSSWRGTLYDRTTESLTSGSSSSQGSSSRWSPGTSGSTRSSPPSDPSGSSSDSGGSSSGSGGGSEKSSWRGGGN